MVSRGGGTSSGVELVPWMTALPRSRAELLAQGSVLELEPGILARRALEGPTFALDVIYLPRNRAFMPHRHANLHLLLVLSGSGFYYQGDTVVHLPVRSLVMVQAEKVHCLGAGGRSLVAAVVSTPKSSLVAEQRGHTISPQRAKRLAAKIRCAEEHDCPYVASTRIILASVEADR